MNRPFLHILSTTEWPSDNLTPPGPQIVALFGLHIPFLPEPLATDAFVNQLDADYEHRLNQQIRFIRTLYPAVGRQLGHDDYAVALRYDPTEAPAPMVLQAPMRTPGRTIAPAPMNVPSPTRTWPVRQACGPTWQ